MTSGTLCSVFPILALGLAAGTAYLATRRADLGVVHAWTALRAVGRPGPARNPPRAAPRFTERTK